VWYVTIREDLWKKEEYPALLKGWHDPIINEVLSYRGVGVKIRFRYARLEEDTPEGFNMVIWTPEMDFVDLANTIDFDFVEEKEKEQCEENERERE
jgi:hypothetical protein